MCIDYRSRGFTLVEMIVAIVIISVGLAGVLSAFNINVRSSADPLVRKQMLSIAEAMLEEVLLKPYENGTAPTNSEVACGAPGAARDTFDDVRDYAGYATRGICDIDGEAVAGLGSYDVSVGITTTSLTDGTTAVASLRVQVTVKRGTESLSLFGWRTDYGS